MYRNDTKPCPGDCRCSRTDAARALNLTLEALDVLPPGGEVILLLYREPTPLYDVLRRNGFTHRTEISDGGEFAVHIRHAAQASGCVTPSPIG
jgi:hypothetical protein